MPRQGTAESAPGYISEKKCPTIFKPSELSNMFTILLSWRLTMEAVRHMTLLVRGGWKVEIRERKSGDEAYSRQGNGHAASPSGGYRRCCASRNAAWQWTSVYSGQRRRAPRSEEHTSEL